MSEYYPKNEEEKEYPKRMLISSCQAPDLPESSQEAGGEREALRGRLVQGQPGDSDCSPCVRWSQHLGRRSFLTLAVNQEGHL